MATGLESSPSWQARAGSSTHCGSDGGYGASRSAACPLWRSSRCWGSSPYRRSRAGSPRSSSAQLLGRKVAIGRIRLNPFALSLAVEDFRILEADGATPFFGFSRLYVNAQISSVFRRAPVIQEIALESLRLHVVRTRATADAWADVGAAYNFSDIVARLAAMPKSPEPTAAARQRARRRASRSTTSTSTTPR